MVFRPLFHLAKQNEQLVMSTLDIKFATNWAPHLYEAPRGLLIIPLDGAAVKGLSNWLLFHKLKDTNDFL